MEKNKISLHISENVKKLCKLNTHLNATTNVLNFRCFGCGNRRQSSQELASFATFKSNTTKLIFVRD